MNRKIQFRLNNRIFAVEIETKNTFLNDDDINKAREALADKLIFNNENIINILFEELLIVCADCGIDLNHEQEKEVGLCYQCENI